MMNMVALALAAQIAAQLPTGAELEKVYWDCDYASITAMLSADDAAVCGTAFEKLKKEKFGGDFSKFMEWWKANKAAEYAKRK